MREKRDQIREEVMRINLDKFAGVLESVSA